MSHVEDIPAGSELRFDGGKARFSMAGDSIVCPRIRGKAVVTGSAADELGVYYNVSGLNGKYALRKSPGGAWWLYDKAGPWMASTATARAHGRTVATCHSRRMVFHIVWKNASSTLRVQIVNAELGADNDGSIPPHRLDYDGNAMESLRKVRSAPMLVEGYRWVAVVRDPVDRFVSLYNHILERRCAKGEPYFDIKRDTVEDMLLICHLLQKATRPLNGNQHFLSQSVLIGPRMPDTFVRMGDVDAFLLDECGLAPLTCNKTRKRPRSISVASLSPDVVGHIRRVFADDYELLSRAEEQGRVWRRTKQPEKP